MKKVTMLLIVALIMIFGSLAVTADENPPAIPEQCIQQTGETREEGGCCSCHDSGALEQLGFNCDGSIVIWWENGTTFGQ